MDCEKSEGLLNGYLDDELERGERAEVERHLAACSACGARVRAERRIRFHITTAVADETAPRALRERVEREIRASVVAAQAVTAPSAEAELPRGSAGRVVVDVATSLRRRRTWPATWLSSRSWFGYGLAAAAVLVAIIGLWMLAPRRGGAEAWAAGLFDDHARHHGPSGRELLVAETNARDLERWFDRRLGLKLALPEWVGDGRLVGGQVCDVNGRRVAHAVYDLAGATVSYYVVPRGDAPEAPTRGEISSVRYLTWKSPSGGVFVLGAVAPSELELFRPPAAALGDRRLTAQPRAG